VSQEDIHEKIKKLSNRVTAAQTRVQDKTVELNRLKNEHTALSNECLDTCGIKLSKLQEKRDEISSELELKVDEADSIYQKIIKEESDGNV
jgi:predicted nuclease with TOPRIM domain